MSILDWLDKFGEVEHVKTSETASIKDLPFRYLGLYFTATWCSSCVRVADKIPHLLATVNKKGNFFRLLTFRLDEDLSNFGSYDLKFKSMNHEGAAEIANWL